MKKKLFLLFAFLLIVFFSLLFIFNLEKSEMEPEVPLEPPIVDEHSKLYIDGVSVEDVIKYFDEICLDAEIINGGDPSKLQKWNSPIYYILYGKYTEEDLKTLSNFTNWLNTIDGFPGIYETKNITNANLKIYFYNKADFIKLMGNDFIEMDGGVTFWYTDDVIYDAIIGYRTDLDQHLRNSVILEEIYNSLGPIQDTLLRSDSIIYSGFSEPQELTKIDELILKLLYNPLLTPGMNKEQCEEVIRNLYY